LLETKSAKIGVLGEVVNPGILVMTEPMRVLDAIKAAGGFSDFGSKSNVIVYRQSENGAISRREVNIAKLLDGKTSAQENVELQPGDTVEVQGNVKKRVALITSLSGISNFMTVMGRGGR
jgi:polysaccharide export outer membrane protein